MEKELLENIKNEVNDMKKIQLFKDIYIWKV